MKNRIYLISAEHYEAATVIARERGIKPKQWKYVPLDKKLRYMAIAGCHAVPKENLIGHFDEEEIMYLTLKAPKRNDPEIDTEIKENRPRTEISRSGDIGLAVEPQDKDKKEEDEE